MHYGCVHAHTIITAITIALTQQSHNALPGRGAPFARGRLLHPALARTLVPLLAPLLPQISGLAKSLHVQDLLVSTEHPSPVLEEEGGGG